MKRSPVTLPRERANNYELSFIKKYCGKEWIPLINHNKQVIRFPKNSLIFVEGQKVEGMYFINEGKVKVYARYNTHKERLIRLAGDQDILGHRGFGANWKYPVSAMALTETTVTFIPNETFTALVKANPVLGYHLMIFYSEELRKSENEMRKLSYMTAQQRIANALLLIIDAYGYDSSDSKKLAFTISRQDFANMTGITYETVIRTLSDLTQNKLIELHGKAIRILNQKKLEKLVQA